MLLLLYLSAVKFSAISYLCLPIFIIDRPGYGMFIQTSWGVSLINMTTVSNNWGDGIKFYLTNLTIHDFRKKFSPEYSFCAINSVPGVAYPFYEWLDLVHVTGDERKSVAIRGYCTRVSFRI